ncbi:MAG: MBL fold metallo-hydrolase, partial [Sporomusa sp.]
MVRIILLFVACLVPILAFAPAAHANGATVFAQDIIATSDGDLKITFVGHGSLILTFKEKVIHVDPYSKLADYSLLPKADAVLITHQHQDHLDLTALAAIIDSDTDIVLNAKSAE